MFTILKHMTLRGALQLPAGMGQKAFKQDVAEAMQELCGSNQGVGEPGSQYQKKCHHESIHGRNHPHVSAIGRGIP